MNFDYLSSKLLCCHDLAKQLSYYLYFFSFLFLFFYLGLTTQKEVRESVMSQVSHSHSHMTGSHSVISHDRCGKEVHRPYSSCISSVEKSNGNFIKFSLSNADKGAVGLILALELASLTLELDSTSRALSALDSAHSQLSSYQLSVADHHDQ